jgi:hypothetical protein
MSDSKLLCTTCGNVAEPKRLTRGSLLIEIVLWLCFIVPGLIYTIWRSTTKFNTCRSCGATTLVPTASPVARTFMKDQGIEAPPERPNAGYAVGKALGNLLNKK